MSEETSTNAEAGAEEDTWNLVFFPQLEGGAAYDEVRDKLAETLKVDKKKVDGWYDAEAPTVLLKAVAKDVAERYMEAILQCGGACNIQNSKESGGLSLVPKSKNVDFFICPSCEYEEEVARGTKYEQCPKCGLVIAKWEEKMREEREKERIRRRLMRDARNAEDDEAERERKRAELERLRELEREIMKELGIKPPSRLWLLFERHPFSISAAGGLLLIGLTAVAVFQVNNYLEQQAQAELRAAAPPKQAQEIAPIMASAIQLQQNGNEAMVAQLAHVTTTMSGSAPTPKQEIIKAAQQMMKGVDPAKFVNTASKKSIPGRTTQPGPGDEKPVPVNNDIVGGVTGIPGVEQFEPDTLAKISPAPVKHGHEKVLGVMREQRMAPDPADPERMIVVDELDEMDGSMIVDLMGELTQDREWDLFLAQNARTFLGDGEIEQASALVERIRNPVIKIEALGDVMLAMLAEEPNVTLKVEMTQVEKELARIEEPDARARSIIALGKRLGDAGYSAEPTDSLERIREMIRGSQDMYERAYLSSRLAIAELEAGNLQLAKSQLETAVSQAGQIQDPVERISAFTRIARRYYDARNPTLANEILSEAQVLAASRLQPQERARIFGEIAIAQGYMGDIKGAMASIDNAGEGVGEQQLLAKLAEFLIGHERFHEADLVMESMTDMIEYSRLQVRAITTLIYEGRIERAKQRLAEAMRYADLIGQAGERGVMMSQLGRLARRVNEDQLAESYFKAAASASEVLTGRRLAVNHGILALEQSRALMSFSSQETMIKVTEAIVRDPVSTEILATERIIQNLMPESVQDRIEPDPQY